MKKIYPLNEHSGSAQGEFFNPNPYTKVGLELLIAETLQLTSGVRTGNTARPYSFGVGYVLPISDLITRLSLLILVLGLCTRLVYSTYLSRSLSVS